MRVLVLHSDVPGDAPPDERDTILTARASAAALRELGHHAELAAFVPSPPGLRAALTDTAADIVFNLVESVFGQDSLSALAPAMLERLAVPYTGSAAAPIAVASDKLLAKRILRAAGLPTPDWAEPPGWDGVDAGKRYVVKSAGEDASLGLDDDAVVTGMQAVATRAQSCAARFGGLWFAEEYVEGREFNVAVLERERAPEILPIPEMRFEHWPDSRPRILGYGAKWDEESEDAANTRRTFGLEAHEPELAARLSVLAHSVWQIFGLRGYMRVDFRVDAAGRPTILEANPNPSLEPDAGFAAAAGRAGLPYQDLIAQILAAARRR
jgi:D-alanine-D-alanine ligase